MDIRDEFLNYFKSKGHDIIPSMSLVPDDATLLFTNAGMVQFKDIFTGLVPIPKNPRATSCQLCVRAGGKHNDLENVGYTARHHTLFEMLGNFSFGDYFKAEAIEYAWEFVTKILKLPTNRLWVTVHHNDKQAYDLWKKIVSEDRIKMFGDKDNFWAMGDTGPCGYCSEIFYDQGDEYFKHKEDYLGGDGDRFLEIWNLVFMEFERTKTNQLLKLPKPSIDTGMGLERVVAIKEGVRNNFDSSLFMPIINDIELLSPIKKNNSNIASFRVIADHLRAITFMLNDGVTFDKVGRGYVLRRILRRAVRHGYKLGFKQPFLNQLVDSVIKVMGNHYTQIQENNLYIKEQIKNEENRFFTTIESGMRLFEDELKKTTNKFSGKTAFILYDTHGFPLDLTADMLKEKNISLDIDEFNKYMQEQKQRAKASWSGSGDKAKEGDFEILLEKFGKNQFIGYEKTSCTTKILALLDENFKLVDKLETNSTGWVMLEKTPFYATSGGQIGDKGILKDKEHIAEVLQTEKFFDINLSKIKLINLDLNVGEEISAVVINRNEIAKHHSATHLLQSALRQVLGNTVAQAGSYNDDTKLRFDFTFNRALSKEELDEIEDLVNSAIAHSIPQETKILPIQEAKKQGAIALFGEKYGDIVRVVKFGDISIEFCGGTHVKNSAEIGSFYITKESGVSSGVRRIEAVCGMSAIKYAKKHFNELNMIKAELKTNNILQGIKKLKNQIKELKYEINHLSQTSTKPLNETTINGIKVIIDKIENGDIKTIIDEYKNKYDKVAIMLFQPKNSKVTIACGVKGIDIKAGDWIKQIAPIVGGGGGGRADFAQAGGKDISKIDEAIKKSFEYLKS
jgi:alanyl-tRNA synthetase